MVHHLPPPPGASEADKDSRVDLCTRRRRFERIRHELRPQPGPCEPAFDKRPRTGESIGSNRYKLRYGEQEA